MIGMLNMISSVMSVWREQFLYAVMYTNANHA